MRARCPAKLRVDLDSSDDRLINPSVASYAGCRGARGVRRGRTREHMNERDTAIPVTRQAIVEAAGEQFGKDGYEGSSFSRIAEAMGRPKSAIGYHLFPSKLALATAVIEHQQHRWNRIDDAIPFPAGIDHLVALLLTAGLDARACPVAHGAIRLLREFAQSGAARPRGFDWGQMVLRHLRAAADAGEIDAGRVSAASASMALNATFGLVDGTRTVPDDQLETQLKALWAPLLTSFGLRDATERIAGIGPQEVPPVHDRGAEEPQQRPDPTTVRTWATANGYEVAERGRISRTVLDAYTAAN